MRCPECGAPCWRNEVGVGVGIVSDEWKCTACDWNDFLRTDDPELPTP